MKRQSANAPIFIEQLLKAKSTGVHKMNSLQAKNLKSILFVLGRNKLTWYHDIEEFKTGSWIGRTSLAYIYEVIKVPTQGAKDDIDLWAF